MKTINLILLIFVLFVQTSKADIPVTVSNPFNTTPNLSAGYSSLALALSDLNLVTSMTGPVTFTLTGGNSETAPVSGFIIGSANLNPVLNSINTVTIVSSGGIVTLNAGSGGTGTPGTAVQDGILILAGADWITIDGLTLADGNTSNPETMEFGIGLFKAGVSDGCQNNTIKNCSVTLNRINNAAGTAPATEGSRGINIVNSTSSAQTTILTVTSTDGSNSDNKFYSNTIQNCNIGIALIGFAAVSPFTLADTGNDIGGSSAATGNSILNFGGAPAAVNLSAGIRTLAQYDNNISNNIILTGEAQLDGFGVSVSSAGDLNNDGYSDVIVGANGNDAGGNAAGKAYIYFGGNAMNNEVDITMTGEAEVDLFRSSVSSASDVNADGYSDVVVGAYSNDAGGSSAGRAYLYLSSAPSVKPILNTVKDVPNDQGGQVYLKWARSGYDVNNISTITDYIVYRSYPPSGGQFSWESRAVIPATKRQFYTFTDNTPFDSLSGSSGTMFYQIMARTSNSSQYWLSGILSGRSIDNIAPLMVAPFNAVSESSNIRLTWNKNTEPDLYNFILYRSTSPVIDPEIAIPLAMVIDSTYLDTAPLSGAYYYFIVAQDVHNNKGPVAVTESPNITLNMTMFIEGFYNSTSNLQVSDTMKVYLRNTVSPFAKVDSAKGVVTSNGSASLLFGNAPSGQYYIVSTHRNSLETLSKSGGESLTRRSAVSYNFSNALSQEFGNNMKQVDASPVRFADFSGDVNQDGFINLADVITIYNDSGNFVTGYKVTDSNGDNITDLSDVLIANNNSVGFVTLVKPWLISNFKC